MQIVSYKRDYNYTIGFDQNGESVGWDKDNINIERYSGNQDIRSVDFSRKDNIIIGNRAFADCSLAGDLVIPDNITEIRSNAFTKSSGINDIYLNLPSDAIGGGLGQGNPFYNGPVGKLYISARYIDDYGAVGDFFPSSNGMEIALWEERGPYIPELVKDYVITNPPEVNEGSQITFTITTQNVPDGSKLWWGVYGIEGQQNILTASDLSPTFGEVTVQNQSAEATISIAKDGIEEDREYFYIALWEESLNNGPAVAISSLVTIIDQSPDYSIVCGSSVTEGSQLQVTVNTQNVDNGTVLYWIASPSNNPAPQFEASQGTFQIQNNTATFNIKPVVDFIEDSPFVFKVYVNSSATTSNYLAVSQNITVNDLSHNFQIIPASDNVDEGSALNVTVVSSNVPNGSVFNWDLTIDGILAEEDFDQASGEVVINGNIGSFSVTPKADFKTEGPKQFLINLRVGNEEIDPLTVSDLITINDTSIDPPVVDTILYRINCGGAQISATDGEIDWAVDTNTTQSQYRTVGGTNVFATNVSNIYSNLITPPAYIPLDVFASERWDASGGDEMLWTFPVANGVYKINLILSELYQTAAGRRTFNVLINGSQVLSNLDLFVEGGGRYSTVFYSFDQITVENGSITIEFQHLIDNPKINGIEIIKTSIDDQSPTYGISASSSSITEGETLPVSINTSNAIGETVYWRISHISTDSNDFVNNNGQLIISSDVENVNIVSIEGDNVQETQTFKVEISTDEFFNSIEGFTQVVSLLALPEPEPVYNFSSYLSFIDEGNILNVGVSTSNVSQGTRVYWKINHVTSDASDFGAEDGFFDVLAGGGGSFTVQTISDTPDDQDETFTISLYDNALFSGPPLATTNLITINDTTSFEPTTLYRINCGGNLVSSTDGKIDWAADTQASPSIYNNSELAGNDTDSTVSIITDSTLTPPPSYVPKAVFQTQRIDISGQVKMEWTFDNLSNANYTVNLYFSEIDPSVTARWQHVFNVNINGSSAFNNYDPYYHTGGVYKAGYESFAVVVTNGTIEIQFFNLSNVGNPVICAIEIIQETEN